MVLGIPVVAADGAGIRFNGTDDGLIVPVNPIAGWRAFTIQVLIDPAPGGAAEQRFLHIEDEHGNRALMEIRLRADGRWCLDTFIQSGGHRLTLIDRSRLHPAGHPAWVALRYDGRQMAHFVNGMEEWADDLKVSPFGAGRTSIGVRMNRVYWFKGVIKEFRFQPRAVPAANLVRLR